SILPSECRIVRRGSSKRRLKVRSANLLDDLRAGHPGPDPDVRGGGRDADEPRGEHVVEILHARDDPADLTRLVERLDVEIAARQPAPGAADDEKREPQINTVPFESFPIHRVFVNLGLADQPGNGTLVGYRAWTCQSRRGIIPGQCVCE